MISEIRLTSGDFTIVEEADYEWLSRYKWVLLSGYAARRDGRTATLMHRIIMEPRNGLVVDHINGNKLDNRRSNLRLATRAENTRNHKKYGGDTTSRFTGVSLDKWSGRWAANIKVDYRFIRLGRFDSEIEAARAYDAAASFHFKDFARLNFEEVTLD